MEVVAASKAYSQQITLPFLTNPINQSINLSSPHDQYLIFLINWNGKDLPDGFTLLVLVELFVTDMVYCLANSH